MPIIWPRGAAPEKFHQQDDDELVNHLIAASVASLVTLILAPPKKPKPDTRAPQITKIATTQPNSDVSHELENLRREVQELREDNLGLHENASLTDMLSAQKTEERDRAYSQLATFLMPRARRRAVISV